MDKRDTIKTGDVVIFSGNTPTGFLLRTFGSTEWNHSGIAVRFKKKSDLQAEQDTEVPSVRREISLTEEGELYILETNTGIRMDDIFGVNVVGAAFSRAEWAFHRYNKIAVRRLHDIFRTPLLAERTLDFYYKNRGSKFPSSSLPFIGIWLGISLAEKDESRNEMFCSELMAHYYSHCIGPQYQNVTGIPFDGKLSTLFGSEAPTTEDMFTPGHYTRDNTPNASIFTNDNSKGEEIIYIAYADMLYVILQPLLIILIIMLAIWMTLPRA